MGSQLSRAAAPCMKADASAGVPASHETQHTNTSSNRQDPAPQLSTLSQDDIVFKSPATLPTILWRRNSAPAPASVTAATPTTIEKERELTAAFDLFYAERCLMSIQLPNDEHEVPAIVPVSSTPAEQQLSKPQRRYQCLICVTPLPDETDLNFKKHVIMPCSRECGSSFCAPCVKHMFVEACTDMTRMPPRCCIPINLSYARPLLSQDEIRLFKAKYEEWLTPSPFYCPVATCSAFIPARLLPRRASPSSETSHGTPSSKIFACPTCKTSICLDCRQLAHPCDPCTVSEFGLDEETTRLLKRWGYKQCPKCRHGLKRMYGCNHMECRCGAHFCYVCLGDPNVCEGCCHQNDEDDEYDDDNQILSGPDENPASAASGEIASAQEETRQNETQTAPPAQSRNLDGGSSSYWMNQDLDFGCEPGEEAVDAFWNCSHWFTPYNIELTQALTRDPSETAMDCVKCWGTTYPVISLANVHRRAGKQMAGRHGTMRTALRRNSTPACPISHRVPLLDPSLIDTDDPSTKVLRDLYGNVVYPAESTHYQRRASIHDLVAAPSSQDVVSKSSLLTASSSSASSNPSSSGISLANECMFCRLLVCDSCMDDLTAA